ncbi:MULTISPECIES: VOC family protein [unclassified Modicisalibacter]|uniref:VOC family protein n=1 Tax=unclassified Modicisalibacter TaxID=2679913 RepID=UPI001CCC01EB|nr:MULTISPECIES: VOC family protein [unclassified Modicisalibacter]MBZ9559861.1 VOC family protein [Modicisalibacter sp. R2A 31.J]MBZ9577313.1 VOC family protein [Modicisalibacter sp. MOD 31.J]
MNINLLVLRCRELEASKQFYELLGFGFVKERHGDGPLHYSSQDAGFVFELYPLKENEEPGNSRIGFSVKGMQQVLSQVAVASQYEFNGSQVYVVRDPDGRKVELKEQ